MIEIFIIYGFFNDLLKNAAKQGLNSVKGTGNQLFGELKNQAVESVVDIGKKELERGVENYKKNARLKRIKSSPMMLKAEIVKLAKANNGELTPQHLITALEMEYSETLTAFGLVMTDKACFLQEGTECPVYIFPAFKNKVLIKLCEYCDSRFENEDVDDPDCPSCGAPLVDSARYV